MSLLPKRFSFRETSIAGIKNIGDMKRVFSTFINAFTLLYNRLYDQIENGGMSTNTWRIKEADATDVADGKSSAVGHLLFQRKIAGVWTTAHTIKGS